MKMIKYTKLNGAGNDFVLIDRKLNQEFNLTPGLVSLLCDRDKGIGADGVLVVADSDKYNFEMQYFNADGSGGTLCGNGARCAIKYAERSGRVTGTADFLSDGVEYLGEILSGDRVKFFLNPPNEIKVNLDVEAAGMLIKAGYVDVGSRHLVIFMNDVKKSAKGNNSYYNDLKDFPVYELGREIRYSSQFAPGGVNVNFIDFSGEKVSIRSYERGVERETLACGTGAVSSSIILALKESFAAPVTLVTKSNAELVVDFKIIDGQVKKLSLAGPVEINFNGEYSF